MQSCSQISASEINVVHSEAQRIHEKTFVVPSLFWYHGFDPPSDIRDHFRSLLWEVTDVIDRAESLLSEDLSSIGVSVQDVIEDIRFLVDRLDISATLIEFWLDDGGGQSPTVPDVPSPSGKTNKKSVTAV